MGGGWYFLSGPFFKVLKRKTHRLGFVIEMTGKRLPYA